MSGRQKGEAKGTVQKKSKAKPAASKKGRTQRVADVGRALRSVYDDTVREDVPDDFLNLLDRLS